MEREVRREGALAETLYADLRAIAGSYMRRQPPGHTLQTTALVHEAYLKLFGSDGRWEDEHHFLAATAQAMRRLLVDRARRRAARPASRSLDAEDEDGRALDEAVVAYEDRSVSLIGLDEALERLAAFDAEMAKAVELRFFAGLGMAETASVLGLTKRTFERRWAATRTWLYAELS